MKSTVQPTPEAKQSRRHEGIANTPGGGLPGAVIMQAAMKDTTGAPGARGYQGSRGSSTGTRAAGHTHIRAGGRKRPGSRAGHRQKKIASSKHGRGCLKPQREGLPCEPSNGALFPFFGGGEGARIAPRGYYALCAASYAAMHCSRRNRRFSSTITSRASCTER